MIWLPATRRARFCWILTLISPALQAQSTPPEAYEDPARQVHWAVGAFFGTGWYQVDENRSVYILRIPPRQTLRKAGFAEDGSRRLGIELQYPVSLGLSKLDGVPDFIEFENYSTISFTPGVQVEIPINQRWSLRPYAHLGYGWEARSHDDAWIWYGGVKSRYRLGESRYRWSLLNGLYYAGYKPQYEDRGQYGAFMTGIEFSQPLASIRNQDDPVQLNWHLTYTWYYDRLNFHVDPDRVESFRDQWEIGIAFARRDRPIRIWFLNLEHVGLAYRFSSDNDFSAITVNFRSPFTY